MPRLLPEITPKNVVKVAAATTALVLGAGLVVSASTYDKLVTVDLDGTKFAVRTTSDTVSAVLADADVATRSTDVVSPVPATDVDNGDTVTIRRAKPLTLVVDGKVTQRTVHEVTVADTLQSLGVKAADDAYLSLPRTERLSVDGTRLVVSNPKKLTIRADGKKRTLVTSAPTVAEVLDEAKIKVGTLDEVKPGLGSYLAAGDALRVVRIEKVTRTETLEVGYDVTVQQDESMFRGDTEVVTEGQPGADRAKVELVLADGKVRKRVIVSRSSIREPIDQVEKRGTKDPNSIDGGVWDRIARCESGGNWHINTGNGYYGGLQFSAATWRSVGGTGLPHQHSKAEQIKRAKILQARSGWGQWSCAAKVGVG